MAVNLPRVFTLRDQLYAACLGLPGLTVDAEVLADLAERLSSQLPGVPPAVLWASVRDHALVELSQDNLYDLCWRLAGNLDRLRAGLPVRPWVGQPTPEWAPVQVLSVETFERRDRNGTGRTPVARCRLRVLAGTACTAELSPVWTVRFIWTMVAPYVGFTRPWGKLPYTDPLELTSLRFQVELDAEFCRDGPGFEKIRCPSSLEKWNRDIMRRRWREQPGFDCPIGAPPEQIPCYRCPRGYQSCPVACHPQDYVKQACSRCGKLSWFDPEGPSDRCVNCR